MISVLWTFDGWYGVTALAGEMRRPERDLPRSIFMGTLGVTLLYVLVNLVYARALPVAAMADSQRIGEAAASSLFGGNSARLVSLAVLISTFGCISSTILYCTRIYLAMAQDGLFFRKLSEIHPRLGRGSEHAPWPLPRLTFPWLLRGALHNVVFASCLFVTGPVRGSRPAKNQPETRAVSHLGLPVVRPSSSYRRPSSGTTRCWKSRPNRGLVLVWSLRESRHTTSGAQGPPAPFLLHLPPPPTEKGRNRPKPKGCGGNLFAPPPVAFISRPSRTRVGRVHVLEVACILSFVSARSHPLVVRLTGLLRL